MSSKLHLLKSFTSLAYAGAVLHQTRCTRVISPLLKMKAQTRTNTAASALPHAATSTIRQEMRISFANYSLSRPSTPALHSHSRCRPSHMFARVAGKSVLPI